MIIEKNIQLKQEDYDMLYSYALKNGYTFSELLKEGAISLINQKKKKSLSGALHQYADPSKIETEHQAWYMSVNND